MTQTTLPPKTAENKGRLPFFAHLDELRSRLIKSLIAIAAGTCLVYPWLDKIVAYLIAPVGQLVFTSPGEAFSANFAVLLTAGLILASPVVLYQIWAFVGLALSQQERGYIFLFGPLSLFLFVGGTVFCYFMIIPISLKFLLSFATPSLVPMISVSHYLSFIANFCLAFGVVFELPLVIVFLASIGIASPGFLIHQRKYAIVFIFIISAILTPSPDYASQILMAIPLVVLYELGIVLARLVYRPRI